MLAADQTRNELIWADVIRALKTDALPSSSRSYVITWKVWPKGYANTFHILSCSSRRYAPARKVDPMY
jgi:hypothetical protein